jgi:hypothetical protein
VRRASQAPLPARPASLGGQRCFVGAPKCASPTRAHLRCELAACGPPGLPLATGGAGRPPAAGRLGAAGPGRGLGDRAAGSAARGPSAAGAGGGSGVRGGRPHRRTLGQPAGRAGLRRLGWGRGMGDSGGGIPVGARSQGEPAGRRGPRAQGSAGPDARAWRAPGQAWTSPARPWPGMAAARAPGAWVDPSRRPSRAHRRGCQTGAGRAPPSASSRGGLRRPVWGGAEWPRRPAGLRA